MAFFDDLKRKAQDVAYIASEKAQEVAVVATEKGKEVAENVKLSAAIASEQRAMDKNYRALGEWYVAELGEEAPEAVADIVAAIRASQAKIAELDAQRAGVAKDEAASCTCEIKVEAEVVEEAPAEEAPVEEAPTEEPAAE